jgi:hypothetical protein
MSKFFPARSEFYMMSTCELHRQVIFQIVLAMETQAAVSSHEFICIVRRGFERGRRKISINNRRAVGKINFGFPINLMRIYCLVKVEVGLIKSFVLDYPGR